MCEMRTLSYGEAIKEAWDIAMQENHNVVMLGEGINDVGGMMGTTEGLAEKYGEARVFDVPLAETGVTGVAVGMALGGLHPIYCHNRPDFLFLAMDQIVNHAAKYRYMSGGQCKIPMMIWATTGQGWGAAAQHSQELHGIFMQIPGLKVISPATPYDAKGLILEALRDENPVLFLDHRRLYSEKGIVPKEGYNISLGKANVLKDGEDITVVTVSSLVPEALKAAEIVEKEGISVELIDLRTIRPLDYDAILASVKKTGRALIIDNDSPVGGLASDISATVSERAFNSLKAPIKRLSYPDTPVPASYKLEEVYFISADSIVETIKVCMKGE